MLNVCTINKNILKLFLRLKLKNNVNFIMAPRCLHKNGDSSERDAFMKKVLWRKRGHFNIINRKHVSSHHATSSPSNSTLEITADFYLIFGNWKEKIKYCWNKHVLFGSSLLWSNATQHTSKDKILSFTDVNRLHINHWVHYSIFNLVELNQWIITQKSALQE